MAVVIDAQDLSIKHGRPIFNPETVPNRRSTPLPLGGSENGTNDVTNLLLLVNIVREMRSVPDHHVPADDTLPVDEAADIGWSIQL